MFLYKINKNFTLMFSLDLVFGQSPHLKLEYYFKELKSTIYAYVLEL